MSSSTSTRGALGHRARLLLLGLALACVGMFAFAGGQAKAAPVTLNMTNAQVNLGSFFEGQAILPGSGAALGFNLWGTPGNGWGSCLVTPPDPATSCGANPTTATIEADVDLAAGTLAIPPNGFRFPVMSVPNPTSNPPGAPVPLTLVATGPLTGTVNTGTGAMTVEGPWAIDVLVGLGFTVEDEGTGPNPFYRCRVDLPGLALTTGTSTPASVGFQGTPLDLAAEGGPTVALTGTWGIPDQSTALYPPAGSVASAEAATRTACGSVDLVAAGRGGIWVSAGIDEPAPYPQCVPPQTGLWPDCKTPTPPPAKAALGKVTVKGSKSVKRNKSTTWTVTVPNTGNATATGVKVSVSGKGVKASGKVKNIAAGGKQSAKIKAKFKKTGKVTVTFKVTSANAGSKTAKAKVTVRK